MLGIGGLIDPHPTPIGRPYGLEGGLDLESDLSDKWALLGELAGSIFGSNDPRQAGGTRDRRGYGFLDGNDPYGIFFGISPKASIW